LAVFGTILAFSTVFAVFYALEWPAVISASFTSAVVWSLWVSFWATLIVVIGVWSYSLTKLPQRK